MLKKNLLSLILALCLCMTLAAPAWASDDIQSISIKEMFEEAVNSPQPLSETESISCTTMLTNEDGDAYLINMYEYLPARIDNGENKSRTFVYSTEEDYYIDLSRGTSSSYWTLTTRANLYNSELPFHFNNR